MKKKKFKPFGIGITKKASEEERKFNERMNKIIDRDCGYTSSQILSLTNHTRVR